MINNFISESAEGKVTHDIIQNALLQGRKGLLESEAKKIINQYGITTTKYVVANSVAEAVQVAKSIGYPLVLKIVSPDIGHKTDAGGVKLNIQNDEEVKGAYEDIMSNIKNIAPDASIQGVLVEQMAKPATEVIIGGLRDLQFGPAVMFGIGGVFVEIFRDVSFRLAPVEKREALDMIQEVKGAKLLSGFRNRATVDISAIVNTIIQVSRIIVAHEEINEIDLNPVLVYPDGIKTVDARIVL